jgi:perosamine synthetase
MSTLKAIPISEPWLGTKERLLLDECVRTGWVSSQGRFVGEFEKAFASYCGVKYGVATSSGTSALHLALASLDIGPGDEVIVPTLSFIGTANPVTYCGAKPVFVDSLPDTWNLDPDAVKKVITRNTRAIMPVHLYGHPAHMDEILTIADRHGLSVIEDACEAHGSEYRGHKVGSLGDIACFSFYGNKIITTGEGGMLVTNDRAVAEKAIILRDHGMSRKKKYWHPYLGFNYRMTNLQAALGVAQMERLEKVVERKRRNARLYSSMLKDVPGITLPQESPWARHVYWLYTVLIDDGFKISRSRVMQELVLRGIETRPVFYPISSMPPYRNGRKQRFSVAERISKRGLSLPSSPLLDKEDIRRICAVFRELADASYALNKLHMESPGSVKEDESNVKGIAFFKPSRPRSVDARYQFINDSGTRCLINQTSGNL